MQYNVKCAPIKFCQILSVNKHKLVFSQCGVYQLY